MRVIFVIFTTIFLVSCANFKTPKKLYSGEVLSPENIVLISDQCSKKCKNKIKARYELKKQKKVRFSTPIIQRVDGRLGQASISNDCGGDHTRNVHNDMIFGSIELELLPGEHIFHVYVNNCNISHSLNLPMTLTLNAGHKYSFVQLSKTTGNTYDRGYRVKWSPIVIDITDNKVIYPNQSIQWHNASTED